MEHLQIQRSFRTQGVGNELFAREPANRELLQHRRVDRRVVLRRHDHDAHAGFKLACLDGSSHAGDTVADDDQLCTFSSCASYLVDCLRDLHVLYLLVRSGSAGPGIAPRSHSHTIVLDACQAGLPAFFSRCPAGSVKVRLSVWVYPLSARPRASASWSARQSAWDSCFRSASVRRRPPPYSAVPAQWRSDNRGSVFVLAQWSYSAGSRR